MTIGTIGRRIRTLLRPVVAARRGRGVRVAAWVTAWVLVVLCELAILSPTMTGAGSALDAVTVLFHLIGGSFAACGLIAWRRRPDNRTGAWLVATGVGFFVAPLAGLLPWAPARAVSVMTPDLWILFFVPLVLNFATAGHLRHTLDRVLIGVIAVEIAVLNPLYLLFAEFEGNVRLVHPDARIAAAIDTTQRSVLILALITTTVLIAVRFAAASAPGRRAMLPSVAATLSLGLFTALLALDLVQGGERTPVVSRVLLWLAICSILVVPIAFLAGLLRSRLARGGLIEVFRGLGSLEPGELRATLARVLGDPGLVIAYPGPDAGSWVDADGTPVALEAYAGAGPARSVSAVERAGERVAVLVYDPSLDDDPELLEAVGGAATIAQENRRLRAEADARLAELLASRRRLLTTADAERRRIERNLHDGAQQGLVTLALQLSLLRRQIREDPAGAEALAATAGEELARSLAELRELARGIHPAVLDQGLDVALETLALRSAVPVTVDAAGLADGPPLPGPVAFALYFVASEALTNTARYAGAGAAEIRVTRTATTATIRVADDGTGGADPALGTGLRGLADRVEALGGHLTVGPGEGGPEGTRAGGRFQGERWQGERSSPQSCPSPYARTIPPADRLRPHPPRWRKGHLHARIWREGGLAADRSARRTCGATGLSTRADGRARTSSRSPVTRTRPSRRAAASGTRPSQTW